MQSFNHSESGLHTSHHPIDGLVNPADQNAHFQFRLSDDTKEEILSHVGKALIHSTGRAMAFIGKGDDKVAELKVLFNSIELGLVPLAEYEQDIQAGVKRLLNPVAPFMRTLAIDPAYFDLIPDQYWKRLRFEPIVSNSMRLLTAQIGRHTFDGTVAIAASEAACIALKVGGDHHAVFMQILDHAIEDSGLDITPLLALTQDPDQHFLAKLCLYGYIRIAAPVAKLFLATISQRSENYPLEYFTDESASILRPEATSFRKFLYDSALIMGQDIFYQEAKTFSEAQNLVRLHQFCDDIAHLCRLDMAAIREILDRQYAMFQRLMAQDDQSER